jgi:Protein of unknown function (DUF1566)/PEP-CTERM motif
MKTTKNLLAVVALSVGLLSATGAYAALTSALGGQVVNDTDLNITWLANANLADTNAFGISGILPGGYMTWYTAQNWIVAMNASNGGAGYLGFNNWRLPTTLQPDVSCGSQLGGVSLGLNCTGSEMGHLFYNELGGVAGSSILTTHNADLALFNNVQSNYYWSGTDYAPNPGAAWEFGMSIGDQEASYKGYDMFAWAVRSGQVVSAVPEPETYAMLLAGLGLIGFTARRRENFNFV